RVYSPTRCTLFPYTTLFRSYAAISGGASADSVRALYRTLLDLRLAAPGAYSNSRVMMDALAQRLASEGKTEMSAVVKSLNPIRRSEEHTSELQSHLNLVCRL